MNVAMIKRLKWIFIFFVITLLCFPALLFCEDIDVSIKGIDNGIKTTKQKDYAEALMNAKLQAIERAGVEITSITKVENFQLKYDIVESKAKAVLLPGFQVMDIGYQTDGTYMIILIGKIRTQKASGTRGEISGKAAVVMRSGDVKYVAKMDFLILSFDRAALGLEADTECKHFLGVPRRLAEFMTKGGVKSLEGFKQIEMDSNETQEWVNKLASCQKAKLEEKMKPYLEKGGAPISFKTELDGSYFVKDISPGKYWIYGKYRIESKTADTAGVDWCVPFEIKGGESLKIDLSNENSVPSLRRKSNP